MTDEPRRQTPGVYRRKVGDAMVTVINDGFLDIPMAILRGTERGDMEALMREHFHEGGPRLTVNAFVIETDANTMLVDAGGGSTTVYSMGQLPRNLSAAGFKLSDFDTVLLTHIHPDHSSGLMDESGKPLFPRADIIVHRDDFDFWSDTERRGRSAAAVPYTGSADALLSSHRGRFHTTQGGEVMPGITQLPLPGHTPGHSGYQLESAGQTLVMWGDTVHVPELQIPLPQITSEFDVDEALAAENRRKIFNHVASGRLLVTGGHLHLPGFAHLVKAGDGFRLVPEAWRVQL
ncbi:MBL fold metallo-hydrolase [Mesorhizobium sp. B2-3-12]|uniref:MBL fold metallo-hydrolase n=1 Tax=Mesorhizobium sp. B2-3-12 TaxID=2589952 RepID=UPI00112BB3DF|nr:MBL fold metallo-hydrolase [Mesorhizobium sp. B2-3-12]TPL85061.1 MBL fold metallo-hydrolase [Mesorhizobium sp. B2-3-12]